MECTIILNQAVKCPYYMGDYICSKPDDKNCYIVAQHNPDLITMPGVFLNSTKGRYDAFRKRM